MAEGEERSTEDLSEEASPYKVEEMRRKGQVAQSRELTGLLAMGATAAAIYALSPKMGAQLAEFMREVFRTDLSARADLGSTAALHSTLVKGLKIFAMIGFPVSCAGFIMGVIASFGQVGAIFTFEPLQPDLTKLDPIQGIQKMFSVRSLIDGVRLIFKMVVVGAVCYAVMKSEVFHSAHYLEQEPVSLFGVYAHSAFVMFASLLGVLLVFALIDFILQRREYGKSVRVTKQEAKEEYKEREGDPMIKSRIRSVQREVARRRMMQAVKTADVVVTNPTHFAVAIKYEKDSMAAPKVVAKGADFLAQRIKKIAADSGVPMVENVPLARTLYASVKVGQYVPRALYQAVAEVLAYVYRLKNRRF